MGVQVTASGSSIACLYCNTEERAFGPVFASQHEGEEFLEWLCARGDDARDLDNTGTLGETVERWQSYEPSDTELYGAGSR